MEEEMEAKEQEKEIDYLRSRHQDWKDVQDYVHNQRERDRKSMAARVAKSRQEKRIMLEQHQANLAKLHEEFYLRKQDNEDIKAFKEQEAQKRRESLALRLDSWKQQKMQRLKEKRQRELEQEEESLIKTQEWCDLQAAKELVAENRMKEALAAQQWIN